MYTPRVVHSLHLHPVAKSLLVQSEGSSAPGLKQRGVLNATLLVKMVHTALVNPQVLRAKGQARVS